MFQVQLGHSYQDCFQNITLLVMTTYEKPSTTKKNLVSSPEKLRNSFATRMSSRTPPLTTYDLHYIAWDINPP